jgi:hypothetical protein
MQQQLSTIKKWIYDPLLSTDDEVRQKLSSCADGTGHPYQDSIIVKKSNGYDRIDISSVDPGFFLNKVSVSDAVREITGRVDRTPQLTSFRGWDVNILTPGQLFETKFDPSLIASFVTTNKTGGDYFDYVVYTDNKVINYNSRTGKGITHSGDVGSLLHYMTFSNAMANDQTFVLGVVGFRMKHLRTFDTQLPAVCIPDPENKIIMVVPCPLDRATIGDNTMACLAVGKKVNNRVQWSVLPQPISAANIDTNHYNSEIIGYERSAITTHNRLYHEQQAQSGVAVAATAAAAAAAVAATAVGAEVSVPASFDNQSQSQAKTVYIREHGLTGQQYPNALHVTYGTGLHVGITPSSDMNVPTVLPCVGSELEGASALALGKPYVGSISPSDYINTLKTSTVIVNVTDKMLEQLIATPKQKINGIFIVHPTKQNEDVKTLMTGVLINAVTAMAGPLSIVLVEISGKRYFYRGVSWLELLDLAPEFGTDVTDQMSDSRIMTWAETHHVGNVLHDDTVRYFNQQKSLNDVLSIIFNYTLDNLGAFVQNNETNQIKDVFTQLEITMSPNEMESFLSKMSAIVKSMIDSNLGQLKKDIANQMMGKGAKEIQQFSRQLGAKRIEIKTKTQWFVDLLGSMISVKGSTSKSHDLNRIVRKSTIANNVAGAKNMSADDLYNLIEDSCHEETGCLIVNINLEVLPSVLLSIRDNKVNSNIENLMQITNISDNLQYLDPISVNAIKDVATEVTPLHGDKNSLVIVNPQRGPAIPFPLLKKYVDLKDPSTIFWIEEANDPTVAKLRILLRGTISGATASRTYNIQPQSRDLGYGVLHMILSAMENFTSGLKNIPNPETDWDNTTCQVIRGMFGFLLTTMASGANPLSMACQLVMQNPKLQVPGPNEWWIYARMMRLYPHTCWRKDYITRNVCRLIIRTIRNTMVLPIITPMLQEAKHGQKKEMDEIRDDRDKELRFLQIAIKILFCFKDKKYNLKQENSETNKQIFTRLLNMKPADTRYTGNHTGYSSICAFLRHAANGNADWGSPYNHALLTAFDIIVKRSCIFRNTKRCMVDSYFGEGSVEKYQTFLSKVESQVPNATAKVQNSQAVSTQDVDMLKGDAEFTRGAWSTYTQENTISHDEMEQTIQNMLSGTGSCPNYVNTKSQLVVATTQPSHPFTGLPNNGGAVKLYECIGTLEPTHVFGSSATSFNMHQFAMLMRLVGVEDVSEVINVMVKTMLERYRDDEGVELALMSKVFSQ